ncbi:uncharacterized protein LOC113201878 [Frankliniella occidentalis]|uniref:Uncharacterized protein LOC113201878 n=1 Tax=Frankliniella occidentalis TaxID=133901 RepID=A0A6J1RYG8_FRAOC|nr:uncharacterized protein LOC113201878 [Frankliniella occidentalis]
MEAQQVRKIVLTDEKMFKLCEVVDDLWQTDKQIQMDGVFVGEFSKADRDGGSPLSQFVEKLKSHLESAKEGEAEGPKRQFLAAFAAAPGVFGHRAFTCKRYEEFGGVNLCTLEDVEAFSLTATSEPSYSTPTCCTTILDSKGQAALIQHIFSDMKSRAGKVLNRNGSRKYLSSAQVTAMKESYDSFMAKFERMSSEEKSKAAMKMVKDDKRVENIGCACIDAENDLPESPAGGVMYASGIPVEPSDELRMSPQYMMLFMGATTMNRLLKEHYSGVTRPMLYFGTTHTFAPVHVEDGSLFSINFLHYGQPKLWFVVPPRAVNQLRNCLADLKTNSLHSDCPNGPLGHKYYVPTAAWMEEKKIPYKVIIQKPKQAVVLYPNAAHWVVNLGMNCAEASNFPSKMWLPYGLASVKCHCIMDQDFHMDLSAMVAVLQPGWMGWMKSGLIPKDISAEDNPQFYERIVLPCRCSVNAQVKDEVQEEEDEDEEEEEEGGGGQRRVVEELPDLPRKRFKMDYKCTKPSCSQAFKGRKKASVWNHLQTHKGEPKYQEYVAAYNKKYRRPIKSKRKPCSVCGKLIVQSPSNMREHQKRKNCIKPEKAK